MWPFNRRKKQQKDSKVPAEVQQYYDQEHRERVWLAWLIAFVSLVVTVAIIAALFLGGRWVYREVTNNNDNGTTSQPASNDQPPQPTPGPSSDSTSDSEAEHENHEDTDNSSNSSADDESEPAPANDQQNGSDQELTNTGPKETVAVFVAVTLIATLGHLAYTKYRLSNS